MKALVWIAVLFTLIALMAAALVPRKTTRNSEKPKRKRPLTDREAAMYNRLTTTLPELIVMPQVAMSALLTARSRASRNTFDRKVADFVLCDKAFQVVAVIELDDRSHDAKKTGDAERDQMLKNAGYKVIRYSNVPNIDEVERDFRPETLDRSTRAEPTLDLDRPVMPGPSNPKAPSVSSSGSSARTV